MSSTSESSPSRLLHRVGEFGATVGRGEPRRRGVRLAIRTGVPVLILAALGYVILKQWNSLPNYDWHFSVGWLGVAFVVQLCFFAISAGVWLLVIRLMGEKLGFIDAQSIYAKSLLARYVPGNMLMILTRVLMAERRGVSRKTSLTSVVYELALMLCGAIIISSYFIFTLPFLEHSIFRWPILASVPLTLVFFHPRVFRPVTDWVLQKLGREPMPAVIGFGAVVVLLVLYCFIWSLIAFSSFAFIKAIYPLPLSKLPLVGAAYALSWMFGLATFISPSGLGTRDGAYAAGLHTFAPVPVAAAIAIGSRIFQTIVELIWAGSSIAIERAFDKRRG